ncbi:MAG TPA: carboxylase, partial [Ramlibacter sp.]|nr:carboxylase [Ramlibacter sp.]
MSRKISVVDTTLRDAHQCLWATRMTTAHMLPVAEDMDNIGFERIDIAGTIQFDVCVRFLKENPWERIRLMRKLMQRTPMSSFTRSKSIMSFDFVPDDIVELWVERLVANGVREIGTFDGLNDVDNMLVTIRAARKAGVRTIGAISYGLSPVHTDEVYVKTATDLVQR